MLGQEENVTHFENDFFNSGLWKLADDQTAKKAAKEIVVEIKEKNEVITEKPNFLMRVLKPITFSFIVGLVIGLIIKNIIGVKNFLEFAENYVKLMLF